MSKKVSKKRGKQGKKGKSDRDKSTSSGSSNDETVPPGKGSSGESKSEPKKESKESDAKESDAKESEPAKAVTIASATAIDTNTPNGVLAIEKADNTIGLVEQAFLMLFLFSLISVGTYQFIAGMLFNVNSTWPFEAIQYLVFAIAMIGAALSAQKGQMMSMDFVSRKLADKNRIILRVTTNLFVIFACYLLVRGGLKGAAATAGAHYELLPQDQAYLVLPIGAALIALHYIFHTICDLLYLSAGMIPPEEEGMKVH